MLSNWLNSDATLTRDEADGVVGADLEDGGDEVVDVDGEAMAGATAELCAATGGGCLWPTRSATTPCSTRSCPSASGGAPGTRLVQGMQRSAGDGISAERALLFARPRLVRRLSLIHI